MAAGRANFLGVNDIMKAFDTFIEEYPYYALCIGKQILWQGDNTPKKREQLDQMLEAAEQAGNSDIMVLQFYPDGTKGPVTAQTPPVASMVCRVVEPAGRNSVGNTDNRLPYDVYQVVQAVKNIPEQLTKMQAQILELQQSEIVEEKEETILDKISGFLSTPVGKMIVDRIIPMPAIAGMANPRPVNQQVSGAPETPAGIEEKSEVGQGDQPLTEEQVQQLGSILDRLAKHCDLIKDLGLLATLADNNTPVFNMLLTQLRAG
jgi:hypothetical protein